MTNQDFSDIAPFEDSTFHEHMARLVNEPEFEHAVKWVLPDVDYPTFATKLQMVDSQEAFQHNVMQPFLDRLEAKTSDGVTAQGFDNYIPGNAYTLISNHRDIVLDASFLNLCLMRRHLPTCEIAIGNNLLIYPWIEELVRLNKSFVVKRDTGLRGALDAAKTLSAYIHYAVSVKGQSVWIAHREGRAKDSNDLTQESLIKMLGLAGEGTFVEHIKALNLAPVSISYEFDPNDYLKAKEFLMRRRDPEFRKSKHDDLLSMETGLMQYKGRIHFTMTECLNPYIDAEVNPSDDRAKVISTVCRLVDNAIHSNYMLFPINYIAYDEITESGRFTDQYTSEDLSRVNAYLDSQLAKVDVPDLTDDERVYMRRMILEMYSNPLRNKLKV